MINRNGMNRTAASMTGFTLFELIVVMVLIGILGVFVAPRLNLTTFRETGFYQQAFSAIRYAQKQAIASGCTVNVTINTTQCLLTWAGVPAPPDCPVNGTNITNPASGKNNFCTDSTAAGSPGASFSFDHIGRPSAAQTITFGSRTILVEAETGYVHAP
jgi:MSHA pilin protein MshC